MDELGIVPRILLATDGTLTHILEAYAGETVNLVKLSHRLVTDVEVRRSCGLDDHERALRRVILLRGSESQATFIHADSVVMLDRLPDGMDEELLTTERPIGKLLAQHRAETFRELLSAWEERNERLAAHFDIEPHDPLLARTYRIFAGGRPIAWITETFPEKFQVALGQKVPPTGARTAGPVLLEGIEPVSGGSALLP